MSSIAVFLMVLHISGYSIIYSLSLFPAISRRFVIRARVDDNILDFCCLLIAFDMLDALCWIMAVMASFTVSMSSNFCTVLNRFLNSSWNSIFFDPIRVASTLSNLFVIIVFLSTSTSILMLVKTCLWSLPMLTWLMNVTSLTISGLFVRM